MILLNDRLALDGCKSQDFLEKITEQLKKLKLKGLSSMALGIAVQIL